MYARHCANRGRTAERFLALTHTAYEQAGTALMVPVPPPPSGASTGRRTAPPGADSPASIGNEPCRTTWASSRRRVERSPSS